ncbi:MAG: decarboxylating NADP(+)-dependent phosphogluconate dehydrogenase, partial [Anaerolineales bacterium]|nr:decarboxylating NADP(+)-dependent phosphogluconate dehydrogenase [Anaerolineales bacterium]
MTQQADIGLIGLAVMGQNLVLNMDDHGFTVAVYNRTVSKVDHFIENEAKGTKVIGTHSLEELVSKLKRPRRVMIMVKAGGPVDAVIESLLPHLEPGDIIIDGGNSHYPDTNRRCATLREKGLYFIGSGVSGGEEGALTGPSIMPGGHEEAWPHVKDIFQSISAKTDEGEPCCDWVGTDGAGHFVKMVHNGIEYGDMQMICETYQLMKDGMDLDNDTMHRVFADWNKGELDSYLIEITRDILAYRDEEGKATVDVILDTAGQKGTGKWT